MSSSPTTPVTEEVARAPGAVGTKIRTSPAVRAAVLRAVSAGLAPLRTPALDDQAVHGDGDGDASEPEGCRP